MRKNHFGDYLIIGEIGIIGVGEISHLTALFLKLSFSKCALLFGLLTGILLVAGAAFLVIKRQGAAKAGPEQGGPGRATGIPEYVLGAIFLAVVASQLIFISMGNTIYRQGDMTVETVGSFLVSDSIYQVNPMTGMPYAQGMPFRLKILCLPSLYGSLCKMTGLHPEIIVQRIVPVAVLLSSYVAFSALGRVFFPEDRRKRLCFLLMVSLLFWAGAYGYGMDGFDVLCCGWRGVTIRNAVLLPWLVSLCLRRKWLCGILCVLAESCMVWTLYGCGACLAVAAGMAAALWCCGRLSRGHGQRGERKKEGER